MSLISVMQKGLIAQRPMETKVSRTTAPTVARNWGSFISSFFEAPLAEKMDYVSQYGRSLWVYVCVNAIAKSASSTDLTLMTDNTASEDPQRRLDRFFSAQFAESNGIGGLLQAMKRVSDYRAEEKANLGDLEPVDDHPLIDLLSNPNPHISQRVLLAGTIIYLKLRGNSFWELVGQRPKAPVGPDNPPAELYLLDPDKMIVVPDPNKFIAGYRYYINGAWVDFEPGDILHFQYFNPRNPWYGQGTIEAGTSAIRADENAQTWNNTFFENDATPGGVLSTDNQLSGPVYDRLKEQWAERHKGMANKHKIAILEQGLEFQQITLSPRDADFIEGRKMNREDILALFGVPPIVAGLETQNYATAREQRKVYWEDTVIPDQELILDVLNQKLCPLFGADLYFDFDRSEVSCLQESQEQKLERIEKGPLSINEQRELLGLDSWGKAGDVILVPSSLVPLEVAASLEEPPSVGDEGQEDEEEETPPPENEDEEEEEGDDEGDDE